MKKLSYLFIVLIFSVSAFGLGALASTNFFTDESTFDSWFADSAKKMEFNAIMTGYPDGSFKGENEVKRSELAVILDRFAEKVVAEELGYENIICTLEMQAGLIIHLQDQAGQAISGAVITSSPKVDEEISEADAVPGHYSGLYEGKGYYKFKIEKEGYAPHIETIKLEQDNCHVFQQERTITLIKFN